MSLSVEEIKEVAFQLAQEKLTANEPIPEFETRFSGILESCLVVPFQKFEKKSLYKGLIAQSAILLYLLIKNHPFQNGNKRIAMTSLFYFLYKNDKWLEVDAKKLYNFTVWVAESPAELKDQVVKAICKFIKTYLVNLKK
jgi:death-on-curing protein